VIHAAGESSPGKLPPGTHAVALAAVDEPALEAVSRRLTWAGVEHVRVVEEGGPYDGQLTAIGLPPGRKEVCGRLLSGLPLLR
jgi:hypothetical protein